MAISLQQFHDQTMNHAFSNYNGGYLGQCVSGGQQLLMQVYGLTCGAWGNAVDYREGGSGGAHLAAAGFTWHAGDLNGIQDGDILVWGQGTWTGVDGHLAYWYQGAIISQNFNGNPAFTAHPFFAPGFLGYWHKDAPVPAAAPAPQPATVVVDGVHPASGVATVTVPELNVRAEPSTSAAITSVLTGGESFNYVGFIVTNGYVWLKSSFGHYVAEGPDDGNSNTVYVSGGVS